MNSGARQDEISIAELTLQTLDFVRSHFKWISISVVTGALLGFLYYYVAPKVYESKMLVRSEILTESYGKIIGENLQNLVREHNSEELALKLNLSPEQAQSISKLEIEGTITKETSLKEGDKFLLTITAQSTDNAIWPSLQSGLIEFLRNNEFVKILVAQRTTYDKRVIAKLDSELIDLQTLKSQIIAGKGSIKNSENLVLMDPTTVNSKIMDFEREKLNVQAHLELVNSVHPIVGFTAFTKPVSPKKSIVIPIAAGVFLLLTVLLLSVQGLRQSTGEDRAN